VRRRRLASHGSTLGLRASACLVLAAACAILASAARADTTAGIAPSFAPDRAGAGTALTLGIGYADEQGAVPAPVTHIVVHLPAGLGINLRGIGTCSHSRLEKQIGRGCPASARVGSGSAHLGAHLGAINLDENATLTAWRGPNQGGHPTLQILGVGLSPLEEHVVVSGVLEPDHAPYGQQLVLSIPPIPTLTGEPNASVLHSSVTIGSAHGRLGGLIRVPRACPPHGFAFGADFSYAEGAGSSTTATVRCP
jgi:hypothetical protein